MNENLKELANKLTIILPLKGRYSYTARYFSYLDEIHFPFSVLVADGSSDKRAQNLLKDKRNYKNIDYNYIKFPEDKTITDFYRKVVEVLRLVKTPYLMFNDNDDFPITSGLIKSIIFLEKNSDYIGCGGKVSGITIGNNNGHEAYGRILGWHEYYPRLMKSSYMPTEFSQSKPIERVLQHALKNNTYLWYSIFRSTPILEKAHQELIENSIDDLNLYEYHIVRSLLASGKIHTARSYFTYIRQRNTSIAAKSIKSWIERLYTSKWMEQFNYHVKLLSQRIAIQTLGTDAEEVEKQYRNFIAKTAERRSIFQAIISTNKKSLNRLIKLREYLFFWWKIPILSSSIGFFQKNLLVIKLAMYDFQEAKSFYKHLTRIQKIIRKKLKNS